MKAFCAGSLMLSVVMLTGLLQQRSSNFEGVVRRAFAAVGYRFPLSPVSSQLNKHMEKNILLETVRIRAPPTNFEDVCFETFCAVRATLQLEDFSTLKVLHAGNLLCAGVFILRAGFRSPLLRLSVFRIVF